jgi:predicted AlkP superfamily pyrophosphatase or phosphodiesterase
MKISGLRFGLAAMLAFWTASCAHSAAPESASAAPITVLISIDGFRPDYLERGQTPTLSRLAAEGAQASMRPAFPSITFPNHYTLVTGVRPDSHGVVNNRMEEAARPGAVFTLSDRTVASDPIWWSGATPIWVTAQQQGVLTGTMFWPGSDYELDGVRPARWRAFDQTLTDFARVDQLLSWLDGPDAERPRLFTLYFDIVDTAGHRFGPDAFEVNAAAAQVDAALARLLAGFEARGIAANLVIVSDHGMADISDERLIDLDAMMPQGAGRVVWDGPLAGIEPAPGRETELDALLTAHPHGECLRKNDAASRYGFGAHPRVPAVICLAETGWRYRSVQIPPYRTPSLGAHGYDPADPEMASIFIAHGPAFRAGTVLPTFDNVSVYPLLAHLIGIVPEAHEGKLADTAPALLAAP